MGAFATTGGVFGFVIGGGPLGGAPCLLTMGGGGLIGGGCPYIGDGGLLTGLSLLAYAASCSAMVIYFSASYIDPAMKGFGGWILPGAALCS